MNKKKERIDVGHNMNKYIEMMKYYYYSIAWEHNKTIYKSNGNMNTTHSLIES